ncbi:MAG TPA: hypothetical protein VIR54_07075 [Vicinamibacterales bacterium]
MAHGDYNCCALCDCKMDYANDATTKEEVCVDCMKALHSAGVMVYTGAELEAWIKANPAVARDLLPALGFYECFYANPVDEAFRAASPTQDQASEGAAR